MNMHHNTSQETETANQTAFVTYLHGIEGQSLKHDTVRSYRSRVKQFISFLNQVNINIDECDSASAFEALQGYKTFLEHSGLTGNSLNARLSAAEHFFSFLGLSISPLKKDPISLGEPQGLTESEHAHLISMIDRLSKRDRAIILLLLGAGIRAQECVALEIDDLIESSSGFSLHVRSGQTARVIPLDDSISSALIEWTKERALYISDEESFFLNQYGKSLTNAGLNFILATIAEQTQIPLTANRLRNTCLKRLANHKCSPLLLAEFGGFKKLESVRRFTLGQILELPKAMLAP